MHNTVRHAGRRNLPATAARRRTLADIQKWICYGPAHACAGATKGKILMRRDAGLTLVDMDAIQTVRNEKTCTPVKCPRCAYGPFTIVGGEIVFAQGRIRPRRAGQTAGIHSVSVAWN